MLVLYGSVSIGKVYNAAGTRSRVTEGRVTVGVGIVNIGVVIVDVLLLLFQRYALICVPSSKVVVELLSLQR